LDVDALSEANSDFIEKATLVLVEYATAGIYNQLFVSKYLVELSKKEELVEFIQKALQNFK